MRSTVCLSTFAALILLIDAAPLPAAPAEPVDPPSLDACTLLTQAEMSAAVGAPMGSGRHTAPGANACSWQWQPQWLPGTGKIVPPPQPFVVSVELSVVPFNKWRFERQKELAGPASATDVAGLGDEAYYYVQTKIMNILKVRRGSIEIQLMVVTDQATDQQSMLDSERTIAAQVLSEL
jgi:hypothetical protein